MIIDKEFENLLPPLSEEDYKGLEESIKADGCRDPLVVWGDTLVDGHNRYKICTQNGISYQIVKRDFPDREAVILWIISNQLNKRNLTPEQRVLIVKKSEAIKNLKKKASENLHTPTGGKKSLTLAETPKSVKVDTRKETAKLANTSQHKVREVDTVLKHGTPEQVKRMEGGEKAGKIVKEIKQREVKPEVKKPQVEDSNLKDFEGAFLANSKDWLMAMEIIQVNCKPDIPSKYKSKFNRIIKDIEDLREFIGG